MSEFLSAYGLFLAKTLTFVLAIGALVAIMASAARRGKPAAERLEVTSLNERYERMAEAVRRAVLPKHALRAHLKELRRRHKAERKSRRQDAGRRPRLFVLDFQGDLRATAVTALREEVSAIVSVAEADDEVLLRLENAGGLVHEHGLAASQLARLRAKGVKLTVAVDKVAASGGYLMACVADRIIAAPFAVVGSIGVLMQLPNFHRWMEERGIDFEQFTAGEYKRTVTMFGENTAEGRAKLQDQLEQTHGLFKDFVTQHRPALDIARVATGEYWYGSQARELGLVDELLTSDDLLLAAREARDLYRVRYVLKKGVVARLSVMAQEALTRLIR